MHRFLTLLALLAVALPGQDFMPLEEIRAGQRGVGRTVFAGTEIEEFDVEILGVLKNFSGPRSSVIFGRLAGGPLAETGVLAGMSGSPVYIGGRLAGAVAFMYPFSTEPLAGIRPIGEMVAGVGDASQARASPLEAWREAAGLPRRQAESSLGPSRRLQPIATPVALGGFGERALDVFREEFRRLGLRPMQGAGGALAAAAAERPSPGSMISVGLIRGDMDFSASGTVTHLQGDTVFAFGHRFLSAGTTEMPMMQAGVMALVPTLSSSFKLSGSGPVIGKITLDRAAGITGQLGAGPSMVPCTIRVRQSGRTAASYSMELVRDAQLTPFLLQIAFFSAISRSERSLGPLTVRVRGGVSFKHGLPRLVLDDIYTGAGGVGQAAALSTAVPLAYLLEAGHSGIEIDSIELEAEAEPADRYTDLVRGWVSHEQARPGEAVEFRFAAKHPDGSEQLRSVSYHVPSSLAAGPVQVTIGDAFTANLQMWRGLFAGRKVRDAAATIRFLNRLRGSDQAYLRIWRRKRSLWLHSDRLDSPPASLRSVLATTSGRAAGALDELSTTIESRRIDGFGGVVRGRLGLQFVVTGS
ncbi:MAG: hypothetical protein OXD30_00950 [Bryobacterales bacterium]|nr:hypothetical protein [Bryobacterales bacterium]